MGYILTGEIALSTAEKMVPFFFFFYVKVSLLGQRVCFATISCLWDFILDSK